jgi:hypothetical protein
MKKTEEYLSQSKYAEHRNVTQRGNGMARNRAFDDALDELKMLHNNKNHNYATAEKVFKEIS